MYLTIPGTKAETGSAVRIAFPPSIALGDSAFTTFGILISPHGRDPACFDGLYNPYRFQHRL